MLMRTLATVLLVVTVGLVAVLCLSGCGASKSQKAEQKAEENRASAPGLQKATFGTGCFWCTEAIFQELKGVKAVISGYSGGQTENPTYRQVCTGETGHAEVVQITFDPAVISYKELLEVFWQTHDPTTLNRQGADIGTQYRSAIFYHDDEQRKLAEHFKKKLDESQAFDDPIITEITAYERFFPAEDSHQNFNDFNSGNRYCRAVIAPKLKKFRAAFAEKLKD